MKHLNYLLYFKFNVLVRESNFLRSNSFSTNLHCSNTILQGVPWNNSDHRQISELVDLTYSLPVVKVVMK